MELNRYSFLRILRCHFPFSLFLPFPALYEHEPRTSRNMQVSRWRKIAHNVCVIYTAIRAWICMYLRARTWRCQVIREITNTERRKTLAYSFAPLALLEDTSISNSVIITFINARSRPALTCKL